MKQSEIIVGNEYLFLNNGNCHEKQAFHNTIVTIISIKKGKVNKKAFHANLRGKRPNRYFTNLGFWANAANLRELTTK
jgi:hypothetical protein